MSAGWYSVENMQWLTICIGLAVDQGTLRPHLISEDLIHHSSALHHSSYPHDSTEEAPLPLEQAVERAFAKGKAGFRGRASGGRPGCQLDMSEPVAREKRQLGTLPGLKLSEPRGRERTDTGSAVFVRYSGCFALNPRNYTPRR